jgi:uncharacterized Tic20 family protein
MAPPILCQKINPKERAMSDSTSVVPESSNEERNIATLVNVGGALFGFLPALIVYLVKKDQSSPWLLEQLREALNFQLTVLIAYIAAGILSALLIGVFLFPIIYLVDLIFCILAAVKNSRGDTYRFPLSIRLVN